jgi:hypothetical protein
LETLQSFRPALRDLALLADAFPSHAPDLPFSIGRVPPQYFAKRIAAFRRIGQGFAFARVAVDAPAIMDLFADGPDLGIEDIAPNPHIPDQAFLVAGSAQTGESVTVAVGVCGCNTTRDPARGTFWLRAGERRVCPECRRVCAFDGERITIAEGADAMTG